MIRIAILEDERTAKAIIYELGKLLHQEEWLFRPFLKASELAAAQQGEEYDIVILKAMFATQRAESVFVRPYEDRVVIYVLHEGDEIEAQNSERTFFLHEKRIIQAEGGYKRTIEKAHGQIEIREYYQTEKIGWLSQKKEWKGIKSIGMEEKTIRKEGKEEKEYRYYISSLKKEIELFSRAVRGHWSIESMHWQLDVTFKEDANQTLDKQAAQNLNVIRKWSLSILKMIEIFRPNLSMKKKRFVISMDPGKFLEEVLAF